jgi:hypothetical protein
MDPLDPHGDVPLWGKSVLQKFIVQIPQCSPCDKIQLLFCAVSDSIVVHSVINTAAFIKKA